MPVDVIVRKADNTLLWYAPLVEDSEYDSATEYRYRISTQTMDELNTHLQGKVAAGQEVGTAFAAASGGAGNFGGYMFSVSPFVNEPPTPSGVVVNGFQRAVLVRWNALAAEEHVQTTVVRVRLSGGGALIGDYKFRHSDAAAWIDQIAASTSEDATIPASLEVLVKHVDDEGFESAWSAAVAVTPNKTTVDEILAERIIGDLIYGNKGIFGDLTVAGSIKNAGVLPFGAAAPYFGSSDPAGGEWLIANGRALSRASYPEAAAFYDPPAPSLTKSAKYYLSSYLQLASPFAGSVVGFTITGPGVAAGTTVIDQYQQSGFYYIRVSKPMTPTTGFQTFTFSEPLGNFNIPDLRGVFPLGASGSFPFGSSGGAAEHTLTAQQNGPHSHGISDGGLHGHNVGAAQATNTPTTGAQTRLTGLGSSGAGAAQGTTSNSGSHNHGGSTESSGSGQPHNNMPPYTAVNWIIRVR